MDFILCNNTILRTEAFNPAGFWSEEGLKVTETLWFANGELPFFTYHLQQINRLFGDLGRPLPVDFPAREELLRLSLRLINKNKAYMGGWLRLTFLFGEGNTHYTGEVTTWPSRSLPLHPEGHIASLSPVIKFSGNRLAVYPFFSETVWKAARWSTPASRAAFPVLLNEKGAVTESAGGNLFCINRNTLTTPALETGCIVDTLREEILLAAESAGFLTIESENLTPAGLIQMEEIFTASEAMGLDWILGIGQRRFVKIKTEHIRNTLVSRGWQTAG